MLSINKHLFCRVFKEAQTQTERLGTNFTHKQSCGFDYLQCGRWPHISPRHFLSPNSGPPSEFTRTLWPKIFSVSQLWLHSSPLPRSSSTSIAPTLTCNSFFFLSLLKIQFFPFDPKKKIQFFLSSLPICFILSSWSIKTQNF